MRRAANPTSRWQMGIGSPQIRGLLDTMTPENKDAIVVGDVLELYLRFRAKQQGMAKEDWIEILDVTMRNLEVRRVAYRHPCACL